MSGSVHILRRLMPLEERKDAYRDDGSLDDAKKLRKKVSSLASSRERYLEVHLA
jgi:hypothetical protein